MQPKTGFPRWVFFFLPLAGVGCGSGEPVELPPPPHAGATVRVACPDGATARLVERHSRGWQGRQRATVQVLDWPAGQEPPDADVWVVAPADMPRWAAAGKLEPVPDSLTAPDAAYALRALLPLYTQNLLVWDHKAYALPLLGEALVCCYRSDLFDDPAHKTAFQAKCNRPLAPPATWKDFEEIAAYFARPADGPARASLPPLPADAAGLERAFFVVAATYANRAVPPEEDVVIRGDDVFSFTYDLANGQPRIASPGFVHALKLLQRLQPFRPADKVAPQEVFARGEPVFCLTEASWVGRFQDRKASSVRDRFNVCRVPAGEVYFAGGNRIEAPRGNLVPYLGGGAWLAVVPRGAAQRDAAFDLLADLSGHDVSSQIIIDAHSDGAWGAAPLRQEHLEFGMRWDTFDLDTARTTALKETVRATLVHRELKNPVLCPRRPDERERREVLAKELRAALQGKDAEEALQSVAKAWTALDDKRGPGVALAEYRISLGLLPK
jgi:multiple sugar transport system substrate-binding protein